MSKTKIHYVYYALKYAGKQEIFTGICSAFFISGGICKEGFFVGVKGVLLMRKFGKLKMLKKCMCLLVTASILTGLLSSCGSDEAAADSTGAIELSQAKDSVEETVGDIESTANASGDETWSIFTYVCGADLESEGGAASANIAEAQQVDIPSNVNFIMETGGANAWSTEGIDAGSLQRWNVKAGSMELLDEQPSASMGLASTLGDFLTWGVANYPADNYMVLLWNHGGGSVSGVEFDELYDDDSLSLTELSEALAAPGVTYEVLGFDTCLMSTIENAAVCSKYANYMVASEEYEPGGGWDYAGWLSYLCENPSSTGLELGTAICDSYYAKCATYGAEDMATLSVIDLSKIPALCDAFNTMSNEMTAVTGDITTYQSFVQGVSKSENYGGNTDEEGYTNMVDLGNLVINTENALPETGENLLTCLFDAVVYNVYGSSRANANGLSVFFPLGVDEEMCTNYADTAAFSNGYLRFVDSLVESWNAPDWAAEPDVLLSTGTDEEIPYEEVAAISAEDYAVAADSYITDEGFYTVEVTAGLEAVESINFSIYYMDYESGEYMLLGLDNDINADWETGVFQDNFRGVWPTINGCLCAPNLIGEGDNYNLYTIPVLLNGEEINLRAAYLFDTAEFVIYGAWAGIDENGMSAKDIIPLEDGDVISPVFTAVNWETSEEQTYYMDEFTVSGPVVMEETALADGDYLYQFEIKDIFGSMYYTDEVIMECAGGEISVYATE